MRNEALELPKYIGHHFVDRKPVSNARAECTVDQKRIGAAINSWLQS